MSTVFIITSVHDGAEADDLLSDGTDLMIVRDSHGAGRYSRRRDEAKRLKSMTSSNYRDRADGMSTPRLIKGRSTRRNDRASRTRRATDDTRADRSPYVLNNRITRNNARYKTTRRARNTSSNRRRTRRDRYRVIRAGSTLNITLLDRLINDKRRKKRDNRRRNSRMLTSRDGKGYRASDDNNVRVEESHGRNDRSTTSSYI